MQNNGMISPFAFPPSPNIPLFSLSPTRPPHHSNSSPRHDSSKKKEDTFKSTPGSQDKTSESSKRSSCAESANKTKIDSSSVHKQNLFIPLQVCTLIAILWLGSTSGSIFMLLSRTQSPSHARSTPRCADCRSRTRE